MIKVSNLINQYPELLKLHLSHDPNLDLQSVAPEDNPTKDSLVFISKPHFVPIASKNRAGAIVVPDSHKEMVPSSLDINVLTSPNPRVAMAILTTEVFGLQKLKKQFEDFSESDLNTHSFIHPTAHVHPSAKISANCFIGPNVTIEKNALIGAGTTVESDSFIGEEVQAIGQVYIGQGTKIEKGCVLHPHSAIGVEGFGYGTDPKTGEHHPINHQGFVILRENVHVGAGTKIDRGTFGFTEIGKHTKIDNLCHIAHNCKIGQSCLITAGFKVAGSTEIGNFLITGGNVTVTGHIKICDNVNLAGLAVVHKSIEKPGAYFGYPLKPLKEGLKNNAAYGSLYQMKKDLVKVLKKLNI